MTEDGGRRTEGGRRRIEDGGRRTEGGGQRSADYPDEIEKQKAFHGAGADYTD